MRVNHIETKDLVVLVSPSDVLVLVPDLYEAGLRDFAGERSVIGEQEYVSLSSLAPAVTYTLDEVELVLDITARYDVLGRKTVDMGRSRPDDIEYTRNASAFVNYAIASRDGDRTGLVGEAGISRGRSLFSSTFSQSAGRFHRGPTAMTFDDPAHLRRWIVGDTPALSVSPVGGLTLLGINVSRKFDLDPYFIRYPGLGLTTSVDTPSTLEVYVNNRLVHREQVAPGQLDVRNLPIVQGSGSVHLLLRDAFGREREVSSEYYLTSRNLARGTSEYSYSLGFVGTPSDRLPRSYGPLAFLASHRTGLTDALTVGFHLETLQGLVNAGPSIAARLPRGEIEVSSAVSVERRGPGGAVWLSYRYQARSIGFGALGRVRSLDSPAFDLERKGQSPLYDASLFAHLPLGARATASVQYGVSHRPDRPREHAVTVLSSMGVTSRSSVMSSASVSADAGGHRRYSVTIGLNYVMGNRSLASATAQFDERGASSTLQLDRSLPTFGTGIGYRVESQAGTTDRWNGLLQYQSQYGRYEVGRSSVGGIESSSYAASGGIVAIGGRLHATQPVREGFGLVRLAGLPGIRGYVENQEVGRTNARGDLIIPRLLPYYANHVRIEPDQLPVNTHIGATEKLIAPPYRAGAIIAFPVARVQTVTGRVVVEGDGKSQAPSLGDLVVSVGASQVVSPLGISGEFYFENLAAGRYPAQVEGSDRDCAFVLTIPASVDPFLKLGNVRCSSGSLPVR